MADVDVSPTLIEKILKLGASIPTPIALAGFGAACAFLIAFLLAHRLTKVREGAVVPPELIIKTLLKMFVWTLCATVAVVFIVSIFNARVSVQSDKNPQYTTGPEETGQPPHTSAPSPTTSAIPPELLKADSGWIPGGRDPVSFCNAQQAALQKQFPNLHVETASRYEFPPQKHKNALGIVTGVSYRYQCSFKTG